MDRFIDTITHQICKQWRTGKIRLKIGEDRKYLLVGPGSEAGFRLVKLVVDHKGNDDVAPMFERSRGLRAKFPRRWYQTEGPTLDAPTGSHTGPRTSFTRNPHTSATYTWLVTMRSPPGTPAAWTRPPCRFPLIRRRMSDSAAAICSGPRMRAATGGPYTVTPHTPNLSFHRLRTSTLPSAGTLEGDFRV